MWAATLGPLEAATAGWRVDRMRDKLLNLATVIMVACALLVAGTTVRRELFAPARTAAGGPTPRAQTDWAQYAVAGHAFGSANAPVTIVEFADFECPFCRTFKARIDTVRSRHPNDVRIVFRHFP